MIKIQDRIISNENVPLIIAEMSGNHNQSLDRALKIVEAAAKAGAHAIKLQTYTADTMTINRSDGDFLINDKTSLWYKKTLYALYKEAHTPWDWHKPIFEKARDLGLIAFSTPFDETAVDFLEELGVPCYKIASFENTDVPLIRKIASTGKPMIVSTGMATVAELDDTVRTAKAYGCRDIVLLKCTSSYPASAENINIRTIPHLKELFNCQVGLSDHTLGIGVAIASIAFGATVIEKHFTLSRAEGGVDAKFSIEPHEMKNLVEETKRAWLSLGTIKYGATKNEIVSMKFRRSLYIVKNIKAGEMLTINNLRCIRPGNGLKPKYYDRVIGKKLRVDVKAGTALSWDLLC